VETPAQSAHSTRLKSPRSQSAQIERTRSRFVDALTSPRRFENREALRALWDHVVVDLHLDGPRLNRGCPVLAHHLEPGRLQALAVEPIGMLT